MTDTSVPADPEPVDPETATPPAEEASAPAEDTAAPAGASSPVTENPDYEKVSDLLSRLNLAPVENAFRAVFQWIAEHSGLEAKSAEAPETTTPPAEPDTTATAS